MPALRSQERVGDPDRSYFLRSPNRCAARGRAGHTGPQTATPVTRDELLRPHFPHRNRVRLGTSPCRARPPMHFSS